MQRKRRPGKRAERKAPPLTEFEQPKKRRPFTVFLIEDDQAVRASLVEALGETHPRAVEVFHLGCSLLFGLLDLLGLLPVLLYVDFLQFPHQVLVLLVPLPLLFGL